MKDDKKEGLGYGVWPGTDDEDSARMFGFLDARENVNFVFDYPEAPDVSSLLMVTRPGRPGTLVCSGSLEDQLAGIAAFLTATANQRQIGLNELLARILGRVREL